MSNEIYLEPVHSILPQAPWHKWINGCTCDGWKNAGMLWAPLKYQCFWDEDYDLSGNFKFETVVHEWSIEGRLIHYCPWCGKQLGES